ncbi:hypothetical protein KCU90_g118, partial [Aureobasidium melanogenum]
MAPAPRTFVPCYSVSLARYRRRTGNLFDALLSTICTRVALSERLYNVISPTTSQKRTLTAVGYLFSAPSANVEKPYRSPEDMNQG